MDRGHEALPVRICGPLRLRLTERPGGRSWSRGHLLEYRPGRGSDKPPQNDQTPNVWPCRFRTPPCPRFALLVSGSPRTGSLTCTKITEEPTSRERRSANFGTWCFTAVLALANSVIVSIDVNTDVLQMCKHKNGGGWSS